MEERQRTGLAIKMATVIVTANILKYFLYATYALNLY